MSYNYPLKYRTIDELLAEVKLDFISYELEDLIRTEQLIKVIKKVNYDLGLRIAKTHEDLLEVEKGMVKMPDNFYVLNFALICDEYELTTSVPQGTHIEERLITPYQSAPPETDICDPPQIDCRTTTCGCSGSCNCNCGCTNACACGNNVCGGCSNCSSLCPQCANENALCNSTTTTITEEVTPGTPIGAVHICGWAPPSQYVENPGSVTINIDGTSYNVSYADHNELEGNLNALGLGTFIINPNVNGAAYISVVDDHTYGDLSMEIGGDPYYPRIGCHTPTYDNTVDGSVCAWMFPIFTLEDATGIQFVIYINGTPYVAPAHQAYTFADVLNWIASLNTLGLGQFTAVETVAGQLLIYVNGNETYGEIWWNNADPRTAQPARCEQVLAPVTVPVTTIEQECYANLPTCRPRVELNCKGETYELVQVVNPATTRVYRTTLPLRILENAQDVACGCPNLYMNTPNTGWIENGFLKTNFETGRVYVNYQGTMEDDQGRLIVPDHDGLNDYYEYAIKKRILENILVNGDTVTKGAMELILMELKAARLYALSIVNTPNFSEMKKVWRMNRKAQYIKYYNMFKSYPSYALARDVNMQVLQNPIN